MFQQLLELIQIAESRDKTNRFLVIKRIFIWYIYMS